MEPRDQPEPQDAGPGQVILVVEDHQGLRDLLANNVAELGHEPLVASNGVEAIELAKQQGRRIAVLLSDVVMPGLSGPNLADRLRAFIPDLRVIYMTGYSDLPADVMVAVEKGDAVLRKPFRFSELERAIAGALLAEGDAGA